MSEDGTGLPESPDGAGMVRDPTEGRAIRWPVELGARLLLATRLVDSSYDLLDRARSALVADLASDALLERFNELAYGANKDYRADSEDFRTYLFPWEERVVADFFPPPPARILVGGAGGGREAFVLARMGYRVVAFDPSAPLATTLATRAPGLQIQAYRAGYGDLPQLFAAQPCAPGARLDELEPFDASIMGWGSFSHLTHENVRLKALTSFGAATNGPIVISFVALRTAATGPASRLARVRRRLPRRPERTPGDWFHASIGYCHPIDRPELERLAGAAGLEVLHHLNFDERQTDSPHAVLGKARSSPDAC